MKISRFTSKNIGTNSYLLEGSEGNLLIDAPGGVADWLKDQEIRIHTVLLTHQHYDHVEDAAALQQTGAIIGAWAPYSKDLTLETWGEAWGLPKIKPFRVDECFVEGEAEVLGQRIGMSHVPGHSADSLTFFFAELGVLFAGDTLFHGSVGRCDLPGGSFEELKQGIEQKLFILADETQVCSGHGDESSIGRERRTNPFLK